MFADPDRLLAVASEIGLVLTPVPRLRQNRPRTAARPTARVRVWRNPRPLAEEFRGLAGADLARADEQTGRTALHQAASCTSGRGEQIRQAAAAGSDVRRGGFQRLDAAAHGSQR